MDCAWEEGQLRYILHTDPTPDSSLYLVHSAREEGQLRYVPHSLPVVDEFQILAYIYKDTHAHTQLRKIPF